MMAGTVRIAILANAAQAKREMASTSKAATGMGRGLSKVGSVAKLGFAAAAVGAVALGSKVASFVGESVDAASKLQQSTGAVEAVFGKQAGGIKKAAEGAAEGFGLSKNAYQELASTLGAGFKNQGIKDFAGETKNVIGLGADLAAQFGGSTTQAVEAIGSLMRGEADPIEKYGVSIKESAISAELAAKGQDKLKGAALEQAKAQARLSLLFKQTKDAQGAFSRESDTLATKQQKNAAAMENLKAKLGTVLLPVFTALANFVSTTLLPAFSQFISFIEQKAPPVIAAISQFISGIKGDGTAAQYLNTVKAVLGTVFAVFQQIASAVMANWPQIKAAVTSTFTSILSVAQSLKQFWDAWGPTISAVVGSAFLTVVKVISGAMQVIAGIIKTVTAVLTGDWRGAWEGIKGILKGALSIIKAIIGNVLNQALAVAKGILNKMGISFTGTWKDILAGVGSRLNQIVNNIKTRLTNARNTVVSVLNIIRSGFTNAWNNIRNTVSNVWNSIVSTIRSKIQSARSTLASGWSSIRSTVSSTWNNIVSTVRAKASALISRVREIPGQIRGMFSNAGSWLADAGRRIISGLLSGINSMIGEVRNKLSSLTNMIPSWKGPAERDAKLLTNAGELIMQSLVKGFDNGERAVQRQLRSLTNHIESYVNPVVTPRVVWEGSGANLTAMQPMSAVGGGNTYEITVTAPVGSSPEDIGRTLVKYVDAYERSGGRRRA